MYNHLISLSTGYIKQIYPWILFSLYKEHTFYYNCIKGGWLMLNSKESQILDIIEDYINANGFSPSIREIGEIIGLSSSSSVHAYMKKLEEKGFIERLENFPRAVRLIKSPENI